MLNSTRPDMDDVDEWNRGFDAYFRPKCHKARQDTATENQTPIWLNGWQAAKVYRVALKVAD